MLSVQTQPNLEIGMTREDYPKPVDTKKNSLLSSEILASSILQNASRAESIPRMSANTGTPQIEAIGVGLGPHMSS